MSFNGGVTTPIDITFYDGGYCSHLACSVIKGGGLQPVRFPALAALIDHPRWGHILFDTGYSEHVFEATAHYPYRIYEKILPITATPEDMVHNKIMQIRHLRADAIKTIIISHFHADHIGGIGDYPQARFISTRQAWEPIKGLRGVKALRHGFLPQLLPDDFEQRTRFLDAPLPPGSHFLQNYFSVIFDIFGDATLFAVCLPGHASGQIGLFLEGRHCPYFLVADAVYTMQAIRDCQRPNAVIKFINEDSKAYWKTLQQLHAFHCDHPSVAIIPSHCGETFRKHGSACTWGYKKLNGVTDTIVPAPI